MKDKKTITIINIIGIVIIIASVFYFLQKDLVLSNRLELKSDFSKKNPMFSVLFPEQRLIKNSDGFIINESPVYFDLRSPIKFDNAKITIEFQNPESTDILLSVQTDQGDWIFENYFLYKNDEKTNDFIKKDVLIDLKNAKIQNGNLKFMISVPEISKIQKKPIIKSINADLYVTRQRSIKKAYLELFKSLYYNSKTLITKAKNKIL